MENKIDDGGPAFPMPSGPEPRVDAFTHYNEGMSLRDYFAAKAMQAMLGAYRDTLTADRDGDTEYTTPARDLILDENHITGEYDGAVGTASDAYIIADAMLAARKAAK